ncbi:hypothetical protein NDU88_004345 [Pleurodeles waltl]|uniref:Uncharacterized protein n=1 Tax=Pleurodeles waltl TaxID=8319 RepID=A0AAV7SIK1_PLEWA|nr:hypothetical protein NDU88_004345 [Pleurodeles waltl]
MVHQQHAQAEDGSPARPLFRVCLISSSRPCVLGPRVVQVSSTAFPRALGLPVSLVRHLLRILSEDPYSKLNQLSFGTNGAEKDWAAFRNVVYNTAITNLDQNTCKHQNWFDDNDVDIQKLLDEKHEAFRSLQQDTTSAFKKAAYNSIKSKVQAKLRKMQNSWLSRKEDEVQKYTDSNKSKLFYNVLKTICEPQFSGTSPLLSADGSTMLTDKSPMLKKWAEHFSHILKRPSTMNTNAIDRMPQVTINNSLAVPPEESEFKEAIKLLSRGKALGCDSIPAEIYKAGGPVLLQKLTDLFQAMWQQKVVLQELNGASMVHLYKRKRNRQSWTTIEESLSWSLPESSSTASLNTWKMDTCQRVSAVSERAKGQRT